MSAIDPRTPEGVAHVARLARLALSPEEADGMREHLVRILGWVDELNALDTEGVPATLHDAPLANGLRADEVAPSLPREQALANAPARNDVGFTVPAVIATE